jgi:hypothetical protein
MSGQMVFFAVLFGQAGQQVGGHLGLEVGETVGGMLGPLLGALIENALAGKSSRTAAGLKRGTWIAIYGIVGFGLASGGVAGLLLGDGAQGIELTQVRPRAFIIGSLGGDAGFRQGPQLFFRGRGVPVFVNPGDGEHFRELNRQGLPVDSFTCAVCATDGSRLLAGGKNGSVQLWDLAARQPVRAFAGHRSMVTSVAFAPDGRRAVSGSEDWTVRLWDLDSGRQLGVCRGHTGAVRELAFSADGQRLSSWSADGTIREWQLPP